MTTELDEQSIVAQMAEEPMGDNNSHGDQVTTERGSCLVCEGPAPKPGRVHIVYGSETYQKGEHFTCIPKTAFDKLMECPRCGGKGKTYVHVFDDHGIVQNCHECRGLGRRTLT